MLSASLVPWSPALSFRQSVFSRRLSPLVLLVSRPAVAHAAMPLKPVVIRRQTSVALRRWFAAMANAAHRQKYASLEDVGSRSNPEAPPQYAAKCAIPDERPVLWQNGGAQHALALEGSLIARVGRSARQHQHLRKIDPPESGRLPVPDHRHGVAVVRTLIGVDCVRTVAGRIRNRACYPVPNPWCVAVARRGRKLNSGNTEARVHSAHNPNMRSLSNRDTVWSGGREVRSQESLKSRRRVPCARRAGSELRAGQICEIYFRGV